MVDATHKFFNASDRSYFAIIKKEVHALAVQQQFTEKRIAEIDLIVAELTSNLGKYATGGNILLGWNEWLQGGYIEIISVDNGPGISDTGRVLFDGFSTSNTLGHGLGSIKRLSDFFDMYSLKGWGTVVVSRVFKTAPVATRLKTFPEIQPLVLAKQGETTSGDGFVLRKGDRTIKFMLADGLGHGPEANLAVNEAAKAFHNIASNSPVEIIRHMHSSVRKTRGLVAMVCIADLIKKTIAFAGVGNISTKLFGINQTVKSILCYNGIIGHNIPGTMNDNILLMDSFQELILCSDGIRSRWDTARYIGINRCDPVIKAVALLKDFNRLTDDSSVVAIKFKR